MRAWKGGFFAFLLLFAQTAALLHAFEHRVGDSSESAGHSCSLCLAAHGLDVPLAATLAVPPLLSFVAALAPQSFYLSPSAPPPARSARAPPFA